MKASTLRGETKHIENDNLTVGQWLDIWFESNQKKWKETTRIQREYIIRLHLMPYLGSYRLQKLDRYINQREFLNRVEGKYGHVLKDLEEQSVTLFSQSLLANGVNFGANN